MRRAVFRGIVVAGLCAGSVAGAQSDPTMNAFFGFDYILGPLSVKWACGGDADPDLKQLKALMAAFPEDAKRASMPDVIAKTHDVAKGPNGLTVLLGDTVSDQTRDQVCALARPLRSDWMTPEGLMGGNAPLPPDQAEAWGAFFRFVSSP